METFAVDITRRAGALLLERFRKPLTVEYKSEGNTNPVTDADKRSEEFLKDAILSRYPGHGVLAEEGSQVEGASSGFTWVLDPLDGTVNYLNGLPIFGVSVGVLYRGEPALGCIFTPAATRADGNVYHARRGGGAFRDGEPIKVWPAGEPQRGRISVFPGSYAGLVRLKGGMRGRVGELRSPGSVAYELAMTASGVIQYAIFTRPWIWDVAAGITLVTEAGGSALFKRGRRDGWDDFRAFTSVDGRGLSVEGLKDWRAAWVFGGANTARYLADRMRPRSRLELKLRRWQRRLF